MLLQECFQVLLLRNGQRDGIGTGLIYSDNGNVADPASSKIVGTFNASSLALPDSSLNRVPLAIAGQHK
jgi:hypothetical protein